MLCDECGNNPACVHFTRIVNNEKIEKHLCEQCASSAGEGCFSEGLNFSVNDLLKAMFNQEMKKAPQSETCCPNCGMTFKDFSRTGKIGCSVCYNIFGEQLELILRRIHGAGTHQGKVPAKAGRHIELRSGIKRLRQDLDRAVQHEEYENAAKFRDQIRALERELTVGETTSNE